MQINSDVRVIFLTAHCPAVRASPGNLLEMQKLRLGPEIGLRLYVNKVPRWFAQVQVCAGPPSEILAAVAAFPAPAC